MVLEQEKLFTFAKCVPAFLCCHIIWELQLQCIFNYCISLSVVWVWHCLSCPELQWLCFGDFEPCSVGWVKISKRCLASSQFTMTWRALVISNKTIKDGGTAPWPVWNKLPTWPYGRILTNRKDKNTEKRFNHRNGEDGWGFPCFAASLCAFSADHFLTLPEHLQTFLDHFMTISWHFLTISW